jgi:putative addiction module killer protein
VSAEFQNSYTRIIAIPYPMGYNDDMEKEIKATNHFNKWFKGLKDVAVKRKVLARLDRLKNDNFGDFKRIDNNLFELRFFFGSGLRIYYAIRSKQVILLLVGGDKSSQSKDIKQAKQILDELE